MTVHKFIPCPSCHGKGKSNVGTLCIVCNATGEVEVKLPRRKDDPSKPKAVATTAALGTFHPDAKKASA